MIVTNAKNATLVWFGLRVWCVLEKKCEKMKREEMQLRQ